MNTPLPLRSSTAPEIEMAQVYRRFHDFLRDHAAAVVPEQDAEDIVHEALAKYYRKLQAGGVRETPNGLRAILYSLVMDCAKDRRRRLKTESKVLALVTGPTAAVRRWTTTHRQQEDEEITRCLDAALDTLRSSWRDPFLLVRRQGLSVAEAAVVLKVNKATVRAHLVRATGALRKELARAGMTPDRVHKRRTTA